MQNWHQMSLRKLRPIYLRGEFSQIKPRLNSISREPWTRLWAKCFAPSDCVYDVGANVGAMSLYFALCVPRGQVVSFEPSPLAYADLVANVGYNGLSNILAVQTGVGQRTGIERFALSCARPSGSMHTWGSGEDTKIVALDDFAGPKPDHLFIDTDGYELGVLAGAARCLTHCQSVMCEFFSDANEREAHPLLTSAGLARLATFRHVKSDRDVPWFQALYARAPEAFAHRLKKIKPRDNRYVMAFG